ncbi:MAG: hypothetical protein JWO31_1852 [Phycisphaerales bacterium]|nr:hypothetical protein [Phycisphaerales bacterium]
MSEKLVYWVIVNEVTEQGTGRRGEPTNRVRLSLS